MSEARRDFVGNVCRACTGAKKPGMAFCRECFFLLPVATRRSLYKHLGDGYAEAYAAAIDWLTQRGHTRNEGAHTWEDVEQQNADALMAATIAVTER